MDGKGGSKPIEAVVWSLGVGAHATAVGPKIGIVRESLSSGRYIVSVGSDKVVVQSGVDLKNGDIVRIFDKTHGPVPGSKVEGSRQTLDHASGLPWRAFFPLGFGGEKASVDLRVYIEKVTGSGTDLDGPAAYFVFTVITESQGEIQWSVYLKKRNVAIQVFNASEKLNKGQLSELINTIENGLKKRGFLFLAPTTVLKRSFKVPKGFRLDVEG